MHIKKWKNKGKENSKSSNSGYYGARRECARHSSLSESTYAPEEKSTVRKVMISGSLIKKLWKRLFR